MEWLRYAKVQVGTAPTTEKLLLPEHLFVACLLVYSDPCINIERGGSLNDADQWTYSTDSWLLY